MDRTRGGRPGPIRCLGLLAALVLAGCGGAETDPSPIVWKEGAVEVRGPALDFAVLTEAGLKEGYPALAGSYETFDGGTRFRPAFPFAAGPIYLARWRREPGGPFVEVRHQFIAAADLSAPPPEVVALYPSGSTLPANVLRLYLHFSRPMNRWEAAQHIRLFRRQEGGGEEIVPEPFVAPDHELWDEGTTRLTLLFDPGRIKQGVGPNEALGPVLEPGASYRLEVAAGWKDARGTPMAEDFEHTFTTTAADRRSPDPEAWELIPPRDADDPLEVLFPEPLDHALLQRLLTVEGPAGDLLPGTIEVSDGERRWHFRPGQPWTPGIHRLRVGPAMEDPSGNRVGRLFDAPLNQAPTDPLQGFYRSFRFPPSGELESPDAGSRERDAP